MKSKPRLPPASYIYKRIKTTDIQVRVAYALSYLKGLAIRMMDRIAIMLCALSGQTSLEPFSDVVLRCAMANLT